MASVLHVIDNEHTDVNESNIDESDYCFSYIRSFELKIRECIPLELKHNVTNKGREWKFIGDHLYNFAMNAPGTTNTLHVTREQYDYLLVLRRDMKRYEEI